jgi:molybdenum cofactor guanylyltransferase
VSTLSVIILAGGHSRRMGQDKALLALPNGQPLLGQTLHIAQQLPAEAVVVVTPWPHRYQSIVPPQVQLIQEQHELPLAGLLAGLPRLPAGPLGGFVQGWTTLTSQWCLLLACDMPYLQSAPLQQWWAWLATQTPALQPLASLVPSSMALTNQKADITHWEPLCGFYHRNALPALIHYLQGLDPQQPAQFSFQAWLKTLPILAYQALPPRLLFNCNTPEDWATAEHKA